MPTPKKTTKPSIKKEVQADMGDASTADTMAEWSGAQDGDTSDSVAEMPELGK